MTQPQPTRLAEAAALNHLGFVAYKDVDSFAEIARPADGGRAKVVPLRPHPGSDAVPAVVAPGATPLAPVVELQRREQIYRWLLALADAIAASTAFYAAMRIWHVGEQWPFLFLPVYAILVNKVQGLYDRDEMVLHKTTVAEWRRILQASVLVGLGVYIGWHTVTDSNKFRHFTLFLLVTSVTFMLATIGRTSARWLARRVTMSERCLVVGEPNDCDDLIRRVNELKDVDVVGATSVAEIGPSERDLAELVSASGVHRIVVGPYASWQEPNILELIRCAKWLGVRVSLLPSVMTVVGVSTAVDTLDSLVLLGVPRFGLTRSSLAVKRTLDIVFAIAWLLVLAPVWLFTAIAVKLDSPGPVLYRQTRVGRDGRHFDIIKFRSMVEGAELLQASLRGMNQAGEGLFKIANDPRVTRVGKLIRRLYIDEIPQLVNVLRGEMSFVGPRPLALSEDELLTGYDRHRLRLTPGITGLWQLRGPMNAPLSEMAKMDYLYASNWSIWHDIDILASTVMRVLGRHGR